MAEIPCRLGEHFPAGSGSPWTLTEVSFYSWRGMPAGATCQGERVRIKRGREVRQTIYTQLPESFHRIELPDRLVTGFPLSEIGLETEAVGRLQGIQLTKRGGHRYIIYYGTEPGSSPSFVSSEELDRIFREILPHRAVTVDLKEFL